MSSGNLWLGFRLTRPGQSSRNPRKCFRPDVAASLLPGGFSHGHGGVRGRPNNTVRSTLISRFILTSPSAPLSWFSLSSMVSGHHQMDHEVARGRYPRSDSRRTGRRRCEASYFPESKSVSDGGRGGGCPSAECASVVRQESSAAVTGRDARPISSDGGSSVPVEQVTKSPRRGRRPTEATPPCARRCRPSSTSR